MSVVRAAAGLGRIATSFRRGIATATEKKNLLGTELTLQVMFCNQMCITLCPHPSVQLLTTVSLCITPVNLQAARPWSEAAKDGFTGTSLDSIFADKKVVVIGVPGLCPSPASLQLNQLFLYQFDTQVLSLGPALRNTYQVRRLVPTVAKCDSDSASGRIYRRV